MGTRLGSNVETVPEEPLDEELVLISFSFELTLPSPYSLTSVKLYIC